MAHQGKIESEEQTGAAEAAPDRGEVEVEEAADNVGSDLDALLADTQRERDEYLELAKRARADFENYRKRVSGETAAAERRAKAAIAGQLLPSLDNLERALRAADVDPDGGPVAAGEQPSEEVSAHTALAQGVALVYNEMRGALERTGVSSFDPIGERFDPSEHDAIATGPAAEDGESGHVIETLERGYRIGEQVIRPARVIVSE